MMSVWQTKKRAFVLLENETGATREQIRGKYSGARSPKISDARKIIYLVLANGQKLGPSETGRICSRDSTTIKQTNEHTLKFRPDLILKAMKIQGQLNAEAQL